MPQIYDKSGKYAAYFPQNQYFCSITIKGGSKNSDFKILKF